MIKSYREEQMYKIKNNRCSPEERWDFNESFEDVLLDKYDIHHDEIEQYYEQIDKLTSLEQDIVCDLVDKFYPNIHNSFEFDGVFYKYHKNETLVSPGQGEKFKAF